MPNLTPPPDDEPQRYVGMAVADARQEAESKGWKRLREVTGENPVITLEWMPDRINFHVRDERVVDCWFH